MCRFSLFVEQFKPNYDCLNLNGTDLVIRGLGCFLVHLLEDKQSLVVGEFDVTLISAF